MESQDFQKEHLDLLLRASALLNSTLSLDGVLAYLLREALTIVGAQNGCVLLLKDGEWEVQTAIPAASETTHFSRTILNQVVKEQNTLCLLDASQDASFGALSSVQCANLRSVICAPLLWRGEVRGAIYLDHRVSEGVFKEEQKRLIEALSQQSAVALENAALHEEREILHKLALREATDELVETQAQLISAHELTSVIAHEVREPLRKISEQLEAGAVRDEVTRLEELMDRFIDFIEPDRSRWKTFSLDEMVSEALDLSLAGPEVEIHRELQPVQIKGDTSSIRQVFLSVLSNAEDSVGRVRESKTITVRCFEEGPGRILEVSDTGSLSEEALSHAFDAFYSTKGVGYRSGLGLTVAREVLRQHGADIVLERLPEGGARATITFPPPATV